MPNGVAKSHLPHKTCARCGRAFAWRKKWERHWEEVKYCSKSCSSNKRHEPTALS